MQLDEMLDVLLNDQHIDAILSHHFLFVNIDEKLIVASKNKENQNILVFIDLITF
jgi:hypothetical protein